MARETKHTPGPWHCATNDYGYLTSVRNSDDTRKICVSRVNNQEESNANMRLIAASPRLVDELKNARVVLARMRRSMSAHPDCTVGSEFDDMTTSAQEMEDEIASLLKEITE